MLVYGSTSSVVAQFMFNKLHFQLVTLYFYPKKFVILFTLFQTQTPLYIICLSTPFNCMCIAYKVYIGKV